MTFSTATPKEKQYLYDTPEELSKEIARIYSRTFTSDLRYKDYTLEEAIQFVAFLIDHNYELWYYNALNSIKNKQ